MTPQRQQWSRAAWFAFFLLASGTALAQRTVRYIEPQWWTFKINEVSLRTDVEVENEKRTTRGSTQPTTRDRTYFAPTLKLIVEGTVYHPNLVEYRIDVEGGVAVRDETLKTGDVVNERAGGNETDTLQRYHAMVRFLKERPYATTLSADRDQSIRDYDFFNRVEIEDEIYRAQSGYRAGPVPFTLDAQHHEQRTTGFEDREFSQTDDTVSLRAQSQRGQYGSTEFSYRYYKFKREEDGLSPSEGTNHSVDLYDTESFGTGERVRLNSMLYYYDMGTKDSPSTSGSVQERLNVRHMEHLESFYDYAFDRRTADEVEDNTHQGSATLRHQLYESLVSAVDVHGLTQESTAPDSTFQVNRYGVGISEGYTKKLSTWGRLALGYSGRVDQEQRTSSGPTLNVINETHRLTDGTITLLNQPRVNIASIVVTDTTGTILYRNLLDYQIIANGQMTEIRRVTGGTIANGQTVLVDYEVENQPDAEFQTYYNAVTFRLDIFGDLLGVYGRYARTMNSDVDTNVVIVPDITDVMLGVDLRWQWLRVGAEYENYDSNLSPFTTARMFQSVMFQPTENQSVSLNLNESWTTYPDADRKLTSYQAIGRYRIQFGPYLVWSAEGGVQQQRGEAADHDLTVARTTLDFAMGKLILQLGYEYSDEDLLGDLRTRHFLYFRGKRTF